MADLLEKVLDAGTNHMHQADVAAGLHARD